MLNNFFLNWVKGKSGLHAWISLYTISFISSLNIKTNCRTLVDKQEYIKALSALDSFRLLNIEIRDRCNITRLCWVHVVKPVTVELGPFSICLCNMSVFFYFVSLTLRIQLTGEDPFPTIWRCRAVYRGPDTASFPYSYLYNLQSARSSISDICLRFQVDLWRSYCVIKWSLIRTVTRWNQRAGACNREDWRRFLTKHL